jgi:signal transduction histidine kinase
VVKEVVDFTEMIDESFDQLKFMDGYENIKRTLKIDSQIHLVTDKTRLQMILNNLISNSIKYRKRNEKECIISVEVIKDMDQMVNLKISDNGMGIAKDNLDKIFEMFFTGNTENHGSGIGLYIVKESIEKLQGKIDVASELNKGTTFTIKLPENSI